MLDQKNSHQLVNSVLLALDLNCFEIWCVGGACCFFESVPVCAGASCFFLVSGMLFRPVQLFFLLVQLFCGYSSFAMQLHVHGFFHLSITVLTFSNTLCNVGLSEAHNTQS